MKAVLQDQIRHVLRFDKDEEVLAGIIDYAKQQGIQGAYISAIGTCSNVELGFFNAFLKDYRRKPFIDNMEITSFSGILSKMGEDLAVHAHGSFANNEFGVIGGHVFSLRVLATCEVFLIALEGELNRQADNEWNLNLLA